MNIKRVNSYDDKRFKLDVLKQHGAYLIDNKPYEIEITANDEAIIRGENKEYFKELIEEFRFNAPQITTFKDIVGNIIINYPKVKLLKLNIKEIQPSQFYIDHDKLDAVSSFINSEKDIVIQVMPYKEGYISLDGHTRLYYAFLKGYKEIYAVESESDDYIFRFVDEAIRRNIKCISDMELIKHDEYEIKWNAYCDEVFKNS